MKVIIMNVAGFNEAMEGMRLAYNSNRKNNDIIYDDVSGLDVVVHKEDYKLLQRLIKNGDSHGKASRMIQVWLDITAPRYWWVEWDTYRVGTVATSESTIHTILKRDLTSDDFEGGMDDKVLDLLNAFRSNKMRYELKRHLPESFLQRRIVNTNYQTLRHMYFDRKNHFLPEWKLFISALNDLPFANLIKTDREDEYEKPANLLF